MMLQDQHYPDWGKAARRFWKQGNHWIILFWYVLLSSLMHLQYATSEHNQCMCTCVCTCVYAGDYEYVCVGARVHEYACVH